MLHIFYSKLNSLSLSNGSSVSIPNEIAETPFQDLSTSVRQWAVKQAIIDETDEIGVMV